MSLLGSSKMARTTKIVNRYVVGTHSKLLDCHNNVCIVIVIARVCNTSANLVTFYILALCSNSFRLILNVTTIIRFIACVHICFHVTVWHFLMKSWYKSQRN